MKQGRADIKGPFDQKIEPKPTIKSPAAVSYLGNAKGNHVMEDGGIHENYPRMDLGNGFSPNGSVRAWTGQGPGAGRTVRKSGSQGEH